MEKVCGAHGFVARNVTHPARGARWRRRPAEAEFDGMP
jgi:hypothetical protein